MWIQVGLQYAARYQCIIEVWSVYVPKWLNPVVCAGLPLSSSLFTSWVSPHLIMADKMSNSPA